jgi:hypothetical protein
MRYGKQARRWWYVLVIGVQCITLGVAQPVWAGIESYDPRLDPNYTRAMSTDPSPDWRAIEALGREFQERSPTAGSRPGAAGQYVQPQPWHYVTVDNPVMASQAGYPGGGFWASPAGGQYPSYWYGSGIYGWWEPSPRIPWWSLVPPRHHHRSSMHMGFHGRHGGGTGHRGR